MGCRWSRSTDVGAREGGRDSRVPIRWRRADLAPMPAGRCPGRPGMSAAERAARDCAEDQPAVSVGGPARAELQGRRLLPSHSRPQHPGGGGLLRLPGRARTYRGRAAPRPRRGHRARTGPRAAPLRTLESGDHEGTRGSSRVATGGRRFTALHLPRGRDHQRHLAARTRIQPPIGRRAACVPLCCRRRASRCFRSIPSG
jgi:hypothetical protein